MLSLNDDLSGFARAIVRGAAPSPQINAGYPEYSATVALDVYRNNYRGNLHDTLAGAYPVIEQLVGKDFFRLLTRKFIEQHPSRSGNLHRYGEQMAALVAAFEPARELVYLADVAVLEWACHCAYFADDAAMLDLIELAQIPSTRYPDLVLLAHTSCHLVRSRYPIASIWHAHQPGAPDDFHIDLDSGPCFALVIRKEDTVQVCALTAADAEWLSGIQSGSALGAATESTLSGFPDFDLQVTLAGLVSKGIFTEFNLKEQP